MLLWPKLVFFMYQVQRVHLFISTNLQNNVYDVFHTLTHGYNPQHPKWPAFMCWLNTVVYFSLLWFFSKQCFCFLALKLQKVHCQCFGELKNNYCSVVFDLSGISSYKVNKYKIFVCCWSLSLVRLVFLNWSWSIFVCCWSLSLVRLVFLNWTHCYNPQHRKWPAFMCWLNTVVYFSLLSWTFFTKQCFCFLALKLQKVQCHCFGELKNNYCWKTDSCLYFKPARLL